MRNVRDMDTTNLGGWLTVIVMVVIVVAVFGPAFKAMLA